MACFGIRICTVNLWAIIIGYTLLVIHTTGLFGSVISAVAVGVVLGRMNEEDAKYAKETYIYENFPLFRGTGWVSYLGQVIGVLVFSYILAVCGVGVLYSIVLLRGIGQRRVPYLRDWMSFIKYLVISYIPFCLLFIYITHWAPVVIIVLVLILALYGSFALGIGFLIAEILNEEIELEMHGGRPNPGEVEMQQFALPQHQHEVHLQLQEQLEQQLRGDDGGIRRQQLLSNIAGPPAM